MRILLLGLIALGVDAQVRVQNPSTLHKPNGYSHVAEVPAGSKMVFIAGQVAINPLGKSVGEGDFESQVKQVFENLKLAVEAAGGKFTDIVKLNYFVDGGRVTREQLPGLRAIRDKYVNTAQPPVSTLVFVKELARAEWLVEVEAVAVIAGAPKK